MRPSWTSQQQQDLTMGPFGRRVADIPAAAGVASALTLALCVAIPAVVTAQPDQVQVQKPRTIEVRRADAETTREELENLLRRLPPSVSQVLKADPSLLTNKEYLAPYPELSSFLAQHPAVLRDARFFVGDADQIWRDRGDAAQQVWRELFGAFIPFSIFIVIAGGILWLLRTALDHRRWQRLVSRQTEIQNKLLDRFASHEDLLTFMQSPAGQRFLQVAATPDTGPFTLAAMPVGRILLAVQLGLVLLVGGVGLQFVSRRLVEVWEPFYVFGTLAIALGAGFILSAAASYVLSNRLGLFDALRPGTARGGAAE